jgi:REP-associated tyrosine transposase
MPRATRIRIPGLIRHITARGNARMRIFLDDQDYRQFVFLLGEIVERFALECWNYCAMPNHYHLTVRPTDWNLSEAIRQLNAGYALWWNKRHDRVGHVFQGRFKDQIVQEDDYLLNVCRYVARNPVRAGIVQRPEEWPWSSYAAIVGVRACPAFLDSALTLQLFGEEDLRVLMQRFSLYVTNDGDPATDDRIRSSERVLGDRTFKSAVTARSTSVVLGPASVSVSS